MGRKSRHRLDKNKKHNNVFLEGDELMALDINSEDRPKNAKQSAKLSRKLKKQKKKERQQEERLQQREQQQKAKVSVWHKIEILGGVAMEKDFIYSSIGSSLDLEFQPLGFHTIDKKCCFYLEANEPAVASIQSLNKRIQGSDGSLLKINTSKVSCPNLALNANQLQVVREVMSQRYNTDTCLLDLTDFHHDRAFLDKDILAPLATSYVMKQVVRVIREHIPHLKALNLSRNNLYGSLNLLQGINTEPPQLHALNLEHNLIGDMQVLSWIKMFPLTELNLQFNPVVNLYKKKPLRYVEMAKKSLPKLKLFDTVDVDTYLAEKAKSNNDPSPATSSSHQDAAASTAGSSSSTVSEPLVRTFLEQYYSLVDAAERNTLVAAYTPDAVLEIKSSIEAITSSVFVGQDMIREALTAFPSTQHQHNTFSLNVQFPSPSTAQATVTGQCQISGLPAVVTFTRSMNIIPFNAGLCCSQDILELR